MGGLSISRGPRFDTATPCAYIYAMQAKRHIKHLFERFGGTTAVARALNLPVTTVHSWVRRGRIPGTYLGDLVLAARRAGVELDPLELIPPRAAQTGSSAA
jgi:hypothetical protein